MGFLLWVYSVWLNPLGGVAVDLHQRAELGICLQQAAAGLYAVAAVDEDRARAGGGEARGVLLDGLGAQGLRPAEDRRAGEAQRAGDLAGLGAVGQQVEGLGLVGSAAHAAPSRPKSAAPERSADARVTGRTPSRGAATMRRPTGL